jgi:diguanylate cyclase (GGDEF)-like protein
LNTLRAASGLLLASVVYYALAEFGMAVFSLKPANITLLWLPSGIALLMSVHWGLKAFPFIVIASFAANLPGMVASPGENPYAHAAVSAVTDGSAGVIAAHLLRKHMPQGLKYVHDLLPFGLWICLGTTTVTSLAISLNLYAGGYIAWREFAPFAVQLVLADSLGILLVFQIYQGWQERQKLTHADLRWIAGITAVIGVLLAIGFLILPGIVFFIVPFLLILSFNVGLLGVSAVTSVSLVCIIAGTAHGLGPFAAADQSDTNFRLMAFLFSTALTILGMALQNRQLIQTEHSRQIWHDAAHHDHLTGLINRRGFVPRLHDMHEHAVLHGTSYAVAMLDLDHFKQINDRYGHQCGDDVLCALTAVITENSRPVDCLARLGGEEFAILLPDHTAAEAAAIAERIRQQLQNRPVSSNNELIPVTVSIGVASLTGPAERDSDVLARADRALYAAKTQGRNRVIVDQPV